MFEPGSRVVQSAFGICPSLKKPKVANLASDANESALMLNAHFAPSSSGRIVRKGKHCQFEA